MGRLLGFDVGARRTGVASTDDLNIVTTPLATVLKPIINTISRVGTGVGTPLPRHPAHGDCIYLDYQATTPVWPSTTRFSGGVWRTWRLPPRPNRTWRRVQARVQVQKRWMRRRRGATRSCCGRCYRLSTWRREKRWVIARGERGRCG